MHYCKPTTSRGGTTKSQMYSGPNPKPPHRYPLGSPRASVPDVGQVIKLVTNAYNLIISSQKSTIYKYQVEVSISEGYMNIPASVLFRHHVSRTIRKILMEDLVPRLIGTRSTRNSVVIDSHLEAIYSSSLFKMPSSDSTSVSPSSDKIVFKNIPLKTDLLSQLNIDIVIKYSESTLLRSQETALLTSILHHEPMLTMLRYGSVYYKSSENLMSNEVQYPRLDLISQHLKGISMSGIRSTTNNQNIVVINCAHSYITQPYRLIDLLVAFIMCRDVDPVRLLHDRPICETYLIPELVSIRGSEEWFTTFNSLLEGFKCRSEGPRGNLNTRFSLTEEAASDLAVIDVKSRKSMTVREYYEKIGIFLNYPNLPCLKTRSSEHPYLPLEMCSLIPGQKVPIFRLSHSARNQLTSLNKPKPHVSKDSSVQARDDLLAINSSIFNAFGLKLSRDSVEAYGSILERPILQYRSKELEPKRDYWESEVFYHAMHLMGNWCVVNTVEVNSSQEDEFFREFSHFCKKFGFNLGKPLYINRAKQDLLENGIDTLIEECQRLLNRNLKLVMFVIDSSSTNLNRLIHLTFDEHPSLTASCLRVDSILNSRQHRSIFRTLIHKLNARLGGTNYTYNRQTLARLSLRLDDLMIIGLDVTHPDNELSGVSIVGCAYTYSNDLFKHRSLVWPQAARTEIINKMDVLVERLLHEYFTENKGRLPKQIIVYRDGVSHEEFKKVRSYEVTKFQKVIDETSSKTKQSKPVLSYIIAQKRHAMRFYQVLNNDRVLNPPSGTLIDQDIVSNNSREFYLYSNTSPQATARPLHYHVLLNGLGIENLQKLTYFLCFNFGKCSATLSMPSSLRYAHNAAYDARNRVIASREFSENRFYPSKFFC